MGCSFFTDEQDEVGGKTEAISIRRGISIYKQPLASGRGSPFWYARVYLPLGSRKIHARSTGTTDVRQAKRFAEEFWADLKLGRVVVPIERDKDNIFRFDRVAERFLDAKRADAGDDERRLRSWKDDDYIYMAGNGMAAFFGGQDIREITTDRIREFLRFNILKSSKGKLAVSTQKRSLVTLRCILKSAFERRLITSIPLMPKLKLKLKDQPRGWFTREEHRRLYVTAWALARADREKGDRGGYTRWMEVADFLIFMVGTFLRPSEWVHLRYGQVAKCRNGEVPYLTIGNVRGKTGIRSVASMPEAVPAYCRMLKRSGGDPAAFLFRDDLGNRTTAKERMRDAMAALMKAARLVPGTDGRARVMYSLRHSAIMFWLLESRTPDHLLLAKNAGTSVDQIERFYGSHLQVGMKLDVLHGRG